MVRKYARNYLSTDIICSSKLTVFLELRSRKTVHFSEQIMSTDKYPSIFSLQMETIVFIILKLSFATCTGLKIGEYSRIFPSFSRGIFAHVTHLDQSCASEKIWWIINIFIIHQILSLSRDWFKHVTWPNILPLKKLGNIREYSPIFKTVHVVKKIWRIMNMIASIWGKNMLRYLSLDMICSSKLTVFLELHSQKTVHFSEQIMSVDK